MNDAKLFAVVTWTKRPVAVLVSKFRGQRIFEALYSTQNKQLKGNKKSLEVQGLVTWISYSLKSCKCISLLTYMRCQRVTI